MPLYSAMSSWYGRTVRNFFGVHLSRNDAETLALFKIGADKCPFLVERQQVPPKAADMYDQSCDLAGRVALGDNVSVNLTSGMLGEKLHS